jgi:hypothetical protein
MRLKRQFTRLVVVGGLAVMTTGLASAGGCIGCCWCGGPQPKPTTQVVTTLPSMLSAIWSTLLTLI